MNTNSYPFFFELLQTPHRWEAVYSSERLQTLERAIDQLQAGQDAGEIANPVYLDARDRLNRALESAWKRLEAPDYAELRGQDKLQDFFHGTYLSVSNGAGKLKKLQQLDHPMLGPYRRLIEETAPLIQMTAALKAKVVKRRVKTDEERAEEEAQQFRLPVNASTTVKKVHALLAEVVAEHFETLKTSLESSYQDSLEKFLQARDKAEQDPERAQLPYHRRGYSPSEHASFMHLGKRVTNVHLVALLHTFLDEGDHPQRSLESYWSRRPDWQALVQAKAQKEAEAIRDYFIFKNLNKIASLIESKGNLAQSDIIGHRLSLEALEGQLRFSFEDQSSFEVALSYVRVVNQYGTAFTRHPITFHNVFLPGNVKMPSPSEERMHTVFLTAKPESSSPKSTPRSRPVRH